MVKGAGAGNSLWNNKEVTVSSITKLATIAGPQHPRAAIDPAWQERAPEAREPVTHRLTAMQTLRIQKGRLDGRAPAIVCCQED